MPDVRPAAEADLPAIVAITNWAIEHTHAHFATEPWTIEQAREELRSTARSHPWIAAAEDDGVVGYAKSKPWIRRGAYAHTAEISVYVHPDHHARGIGRMLYDRLLDELRVRGFRVLIAGIALPNEASVRLHEAIGMAHVGSFRNVGVKHGVLRDVGYWQMELRDGHPPD